MLRLQTRLVAFCLSALLCHCLLADDEPPSGSKPLESPAADEEFVTRYVAEFPVDDYQIYDVPDVGRFYLKAAENVVAHPDVYDHVKATIRRGEVWEEHVNLTMRALAQPGTVAIDVGAHIGSHTVTLSKLMGRDGKVYAFEPQLERYRHLCKNLELNNCRNTVPLRYAIGDNSDIIEIARERVSDIGSGGEKVHLRTLDSFGLSNVSLIKIDVESYEDYVINGASETIRKNRPIVLVEIRGGTSLTAASAEQRRQIENTIAKLKAFDYAVVSIGFHDYLAVPSERERAVQRALKRELTQRRTWRRSLLPAAIVAVSFATAFMAVLIWWSNRRRRSRDESDAV